MTVETTTFKVKLTKISANENKLRTNEVVGECEELPQVGTRFSMTAKGIDFGYRLVETSVVKSLDQETLFFEDGPSSHYFLFNTENSQYKLELF